MEVILNLKKILISYKFILFLLFLLGLGAGVATFLESIYDTQTAQILVYNALWYEILMFVLSLCLTLVIIHTKMWKNFGAFVLHLAFIVIIIGAFLTRHFGFEGILHIREGNSENEMLSVKPYFQIKSTNDTFIYPLNLSKLGDNYFSFTKEINSKKLTINFSAYEPAESKNERSTLVVEAYFDKEEPKTIDIKGGPGWFGEPHIVDLNGENIELSWGSKLIELPFSIKLVDFKLERYPGSMSPSSYASDIEILDKNKEKTLDYKIFMNNPLSFEGYKFFQSSYDTDEMGTILEVNKDPGKWPTYLGYLLLCVGFIGNFFTKQSRFLKLIKFVKTAQVAILTPFILFAFLSTDLKADAKDLEQFKQNTANHATNNFSMLLVQDYMGRIKPISTEAHEIINKISMQNSLFGLSPEQIILGMSTNPALWQDLEIIKIKNKEIKRLLNLPDDKNFVSFKFMFDENGYYKLSKEVDRANEKAVSKRTTFDNEIIKFDERLNIAYLTFKGIFFKFIPIPDDEENKWISPNDAFSDDRISIETKSILNDYFTGLQEGIANNEWQNANEALSKLQEYQKVTSKNILPSDMQIHIEVIYNHLSIFKNLVYFYLILGLFSLFVGLVSIFLSKHSSNLERLIFAIFVFGFLFHTLGLALRWYISGHAPWSDSYESMIYIGWSAALAGVVVFRRSMLTLAASSLLAAIVMLVAHMSFVNPQITNLVPVLKSYWLTVHVSVITASYGFLGLGSLLGIIALVLMIFKNDKNKKELNFQISRIAAIDEICLIIGISMLTVGNFFGGIWANESWGRYWGWDSKETWSFVSIIVYAIVLHLRFINVFNNVYTFLVASVFAYLSIVMTYFGVNFYLTGMHSYAATGEAPQIPNFVYFILISLVLISILGFRGRGIKSI